MKMTLNALTVEHFKGIKRFGIAPNGANLSVTGRNKLGKTTLYDAFLWLLFGKNSAGETKFNIKPTNEPAETENYVEAAFTVDGKPLTLKKVYASKYIKATGDYKGSELEYYINGVPKKKNEYEAAIAAIIDEEQFKLLTNPKHFTEVLDWKKRREILSSLAETKSDSELAAESPDFLGIQAELENMGNASELLKAVTAQVKKNSERINILPKLINENAAKLSQIAAISESDLAARNAAIKTTVAENNEKIGRLKAWKPAESPEYRELQADLRGVIDSNEAHKRVQRKEYERQLDEAYNKKRGLLAELDTLKRAKSQYERDIENFNLKQNDLTTLRKKITDEEWSGDAVCPTCGQAMPEEKLTQAKEAFDVVKVNRLAVIAGKFKEVSGSLTKALAENSTTYQKITEVENKLAEIKLPEEPASVDVPEYMERKKIIEGKLAALDEAFSCSENPNNSEIERLSEENTALEKELTENLRVMSEMRRNADLNARIDELKAEQAHLRDEQAKLQKRLDLANAFVRYKTDMITDSVNGMFQTVKFKLFEPNKTNDGLQECCEAVAFGAARYGDINTAGKILAGIDIIAALAERYGLSVPLFVDNIDGLDGESFAALTERVKGKMQLITLRVSEDNELRTEVF